MSRSAMSSSVIASSASTRPAMAAMTMPAAGRDTCWSAPAAATSAIAPSRTSCTRCIRPSGRVAAPKQAYRAVLPRRTDAQFAQCGAERLQGTQLRDGGDPEDDAHHALPDHHDVVHARSVRRRQLPSDARQAGYRCRHTSHTGRTSGPITEFSRDTPTLADRVVRRWACALPRRGSDSCGAVGQTAAARRRRHPQFGESMRVRSECGCLDISPTHAGRHGASCGRGTDCPR